MRWLVSFLITMSVAGVTMPARSQLIPGGPSGDFRVPDRPGTAPTVGPPGGPSPMPDPMMFRDMLSPRSPDDVIKSIDKDLGRSMVERPGSTPSVNFERELRLPADKFK